MAATATAAARTKTVDQFTTLCMGEDTGDRHGVRVGDSRSGRAGSPWPFCRFPRLSRRPSGRIARVSAPFTVLFVCVGNICRSPLAERLLRERLREQLGGSRDEVIVESAGVRALVGWPMDELAAQELARLGLSNDTFRAHQLTEQMTAQADLVLTATKELRSRVLEDAPAALRRTFTIREFAALVDGVTAESPQQLVADAAQRRSSANVTDYDVPDPVDAGAAVHREAAGLIDIALVPIARAIASAVRHSASALRTS